MDEQELVRRSKEGDEEAFGALVGIYKTKVFNMAFSLTQNREIADDLAQEVFIKTYFALSKFKEKSRFGTWLFRITVNHVKDYLRKKGPLKQVSFKETMSYSSLREDKMIQKEQEMEQTQRIRIIHLALKMLPEKYQVILSLRDIQGYAYEEISRILNISQGTVDSRLHRARTRLRKQAKLYLKKEGERP